MPDSKSNNAAIDAKRDIRISKSLAKLLRHNAKSEGLSIDSDGYVPLSEIISHNYMKTNHATIDDIMRIVETNSKKRFKLKQTGAHSYHICALQGHSIPSIAYGQSENLAPIVDTWPKFIVHGTYVEKLPLIIESGGLSKMSRNHIHFTFAIPVISGIRSSCNCLIVMDVEKLKGSNLPFFQSKNGVILSPGDQNGFISTDFIEKIIDHKRGDITKSILSGK
ncbi:tRNA 2'-phosphotransferase [Pichia kudriavzevii]|uniref:2'-phosphotransferase n=1 Tax=Pichia kudriavzevii TaxID=4909 RepID=A0A1V2LQK8_PICKU|nr:tRNA 2'-phosphotransferase [Pichia kudriavzevii]